MRLTIFAMLGALAVVALSATADKPGETSPARKQPPLVVHEWGTFTNYSGSDGVQLEFRPLIEHDLPGFVRHAWNPTGRNLVFGKSSVGAFQRMETPVTYFYTPVERDVQVRVRFPQGLLTEFFPPVVAATSIEWQRLNSGNPTDSDLTNGVVDWGTVHLIPMESLSPGIADLKLAQSMGRLLSEKIVPDAASQPHYVHARETDAALVQVRVGKQHPDMNKGDYFEKFLFYRGLGNFTLPLNLTAQGQGVYHLKNTGTDAIRSLFLVNVRSGQVRFSNYQRIDGNAELAVRESTSTGTIDGLAEAVAQALVEEGLYRKEADAMVKSWRDSWFGEEGTRLLYMVPQRLTDELLPLEITPQPDTTVRVLVGRMEIMSPEEENQIVALVQRSATARRTEPKAADGASATISPGRAAAFNELFALGRFADPALVRVRKVATDEIIRDEAELLRYELRIQHSQ